MDSAHLIGSRRLINATSIRIRGVSWLQSGMAWMGLVVFDAAQHAFSMRAAYLHSDWTLRFGLPALDWLPWALATPWMVSYARRYRLFPTVSIRVALPHLRLLVVISVIFVAWSELVEILLDPQAQSQASGITLTHPLGKLSYGLFTLLIVCCIIHCITRVMDSAARIGIQHTVAAQRKEQFAKERLDALIREIDPQSVLEALNAVAGLVRTRQNDLAITKLVGLATRLRRSTPAMTWEKHHDGCNESGDPANG